MAVELKFSGGTLELHGLPAAMASVLPEPCRWDPRSNCLRLPAVAYAPLLRQLAVRSIDYSDNARRYGELAAGLQVLRRPRPFQSEALAAWQAGSGRGMVVLPTGAGKSHVALLAIDAVRCDTLVVAPTLDLVAQWYDLLKMNFRCDVGIIGGGEHTVLPLTVTTYDSAYMHMEHLGARFGMVVFDEAHHLPGEAYALAAQSCLAPYRLGLTATPERADGRHRLLDALIGPTCYRRDIGDLAGDYLATYHVEQVSVQLTDEERRDYDSERALYLDFLRQQGIRMGSPDGWAMFVMRASLSAAGRRAMLGYQRQRQIAFAAPSKLAYVEQLLHRHRRDRLLLFSERNSTVHTMARRFLVPAITHQTKVSERSAILKGFADGTYNVVATSKVLNEGVDMPAANVAVVVSGSGSVREHVQRLGRILRKQGDKHALLYELVAHNTAETATSTRRREHVAYA